VTRQPEAELNLLDLQKRQIPKKVYPIRIGMELTSVLITLGNESDKVLPNILYSLLKSIYLINPSQANIQPSPTQSSLV
jgi:hypothetical protein